MSWPPASPGHGQRARDDPVTAETLEDRINMYINAMDRASSINDSHHSTQLQRDIQQLVDLMERVQAGQPVLECEVPPPLAITPQNDVLANPLGELSSLLADYHKALYFAEEELSEDRIHKIQRLQRGLQEIHGLQKRAQAGFPVRADEIPPPVTIPSDDEFDPDAEKTITERLGQYKSVMDVSDSLKGRDRVRLSKIQSGIRTLEFLMTRAKAKRPVWRKDIPPEPDYPVQGQAQQKKIENRSKLTIQVRSLVLRVSKLLDNCKDESERKSQVEEVLQRLKSIESELADTSKDCSHVVIDVLIPMVDRLEKSFEKDKPNTQTPEQPSKAENLALIEKRLQEYKDAALHAKQENQISHATQHFRVVKGLRPLKEALERGEQVDMTLVPPPPRQLTPVTESLPTVADVSQDQDSKKLNSSSRGATAHLSNIDIKPAMETAEDKLAKKLTSYLDNGDIPVQSGGSESSSNVNTPSTTATTMIDNKINSTHQLVPKVQNEERQQQNQGPDAAAAGTSEGNKRISLSSIGMLSCDNGCASEGVVHSGDPSNSLAPVLEQENLNQNSEKEIVGEGLEHEALKNSSIKQSSDTEGARPHSDTEGVGSEEAESDVHSKSDKQVVAENLHKVSDGEEDTSKSQPDSENVIPVPSGKAVDQKEKATPFTKKGLDSVGFLSCQNVSDASSIQQPHHTKSSQNTPWDTPHTSENKPSKASISDGKGEQVTNSPGRDGLTDPPVKVQGEILASSGTERKSISSSDESTTAEQPQTVISKGNFSDTAAMDEARSDFGMSQVPTVINTHEKVFPASLSDVDKKCSPLSSDGNPRLSTNVSSSEIHGKEKDSHFSHIPENTNLRNDSDLKDVSFSTQNLGRGEEVTAESSKVDSGGQQSLVKDVSLSDMSEFQELMDSMSVPSLLSGKPSVDVGQTTDHQSLKAASKIPESSSVHSGARPNGDVISENSKMRENAETASFEDDLSFSLRQIHLTSKPSSMPSSISEPSPVSISNEDVTQTPFQNNLCSTSSVDIKPGIDNRSTTTSCPADSMKVKNASNGNIGHSSHTVSSIGIQGSDTPSWMSNQEVTSSSQWGLSSMWAGQGKRSTGCTLTCLENLKYDFLLAKAKDTEEAKKEAERLETQMNEIKERLRKEGRSTWDVYKSCVEADLVFLNQRIAAALKGQEWKELRCLSEKKTLAEKELAVLRKRLPEIKL